METGPRATTHEVDRAADLRTNPDTNLDGPGRVWLYDGQVNYVTDVNDDDCRLLAGGPEMRTLYADRIASSRYVSTWAR